jgi:hypothetical protein
VIALTEKSAIPLFDRAQHHFSVPTAFAPAVACTGGPGRPRGRRKCGLPLTAVSAMAGFRLLRVATYLSGILLTIVVPFEALAGVESTVPGPRSSSASRIESFAIFIEEASRRFAIPVHWIRAVMQVESGGDDRAISPKGALGPMQIMPRTWVELSVRYGLGIDPFDPRDNIMAGAAYLREMHERFGTQGFLAAYNAGPDRYEQHLAGGRPLPAETQAYVAALAPLIASRQKESVASGAGHAIPLRQAPLFVEQSGRNFIDGGLAPAVRLKSSPELPSTANPSALVPRASGLFVRRSKGTQSQ